MFFLATIISAAFLVGYYALCAYGFARAGGFDFLARLKTRTLLIALGALIVMVVLVGVEISQEHYIYYWDSRMYWEKCYSFSDLLYADTPDALGQLFHSLQNDEYNLLIPAITSLPLRVFGAEYVHYVLVIAAFFLAPAFAALSVLASKIVAVRFTASPDVVFLIALAAVLCFPLNYRALLLGYGDGVSLLPFVTLLLLLFDYNIDRKRCVGDIAIALLTVGAILLRRYNSFFVAGYAAMMVVLAIVWLLRADDGALRRRRAVRILTHYAFMVAIVLAILITLFPTLVSNILLKDYSMAYDAYDASFYGKVHALFVYFGYFIAALILAGGVISCLRRKNRGVYFLLLGDVLFILWLFFRIQAMDNHHLYVILPQVECLTFLSFFAIADCCATKVRCFIPIGVALIYLFNMVYAAIVPMHSEAVTESHVLSIPYEPRVRNDIPVLREIVDYLNGLYERDGLRTYVCASGLVFNHDVIRALDLPYHPDALEGQLMTSDVDLRDGFPVDFLNADIVVTTDPIETHLKDGSQEVVRYLAEQVMDPASPIGRHFERLKTFTIDNGIEVEVYRKTSPLTAEDIESLRAYFNGLYPDQPQLFDERIAAFQQ